MLDVKNIICGYDSVTAIHNVSFKAETGRVTCLMGRNGAGKTTCLKAVMGSVALWGGEITLDNTRLDRLESHHVVKHGVAIVPQGRRLFSEMTVQENIEVGMVARNSGASVLEEMLNLFPILRERLKQQAGTLSGGEQQMLAMARALAIRPSLLLLDEPIEGLQPSVVDAIIDVILYLKKEGVSILLVEQKLDCVMKLADKVVFIENGYSREETDGAKIKPNSPLLKKYIGV